MNRLCWCGIKTKNVPCDKCKTKRRGEKRSDDYDRPWRVLSERFRAEHPLCHDCWSSGREEPSRDVHHVIPIRDAPHRRLDVNNLEMTLRVNGQVRPPICMSWISKILVKPGV